MTRKLIVSMIAGGLMLGATSVWAQHEGHNHAHAKVGKPAPDFALTGIDGKTYKLSDMKGKIVVLEWTNCKCPFVKRHQKQEQTMQKTFAQFKDKGVVWLAIDSTNKDYAGGYTNATIKEWATDKEVKLPFPVLRDADGKVGHIYSATTTPHMFVIDKNGVLAYSGAIDNNPRGQIKEPINYVSKAVDALLKDSTVEVATTRPYGCSVKYAY